ncbi:SusC/RagA family TonB-linked outer membrane protein [Rubrivirga marina]|uniref:TonB-dependent receptor plug domain-containing protein n=1 Tax=Rubrivirga marina TaxID=1196024 RepID=A0A271J4Z2_9BACT|nr:TonB-dependent receptor [Rubrivirga marina]PAP78420.1 hypothetical protein BSZ37_19320 [Rubrivirga marina]
MKRSTLLALLLPLFSTAAWGQQHTVTGTVTSAEDGSPLPGVNVVLLGTTTGTATDAEGAYTLGVPTDEGVLVFSFIGYELQEVEIGGRSEIDVALEPSSQLIDDVVVIGYGEETRRNLASATTSVSAAELQNIPVAGVDAALQGKTSGVQVLQNSGTPGGGISVRIRGHASIDASNQPLYVVDGVPMISEDVSQFGFGGQDLTAVTNLSPSDIESVDILKDAAATAIYGSRGANGVVMITTKRGRATRSTITLDSYVGTQNVVRELELANAQEYVAFMNEAARNDNPNAGDPFGDPSAVTTDTDWQGEVFRTAPIQSHSLAIRGGDERTRYYLSGSYFDQQGVVIGSGYERANARLNFDFNATNRLYLKSSLTLSREANNRIENDNTIRGVLTNAIANPPDVPVRNPDGTFTGTADGLAYPNGVAIGTLNTGEALTYRAIGNLTAEYSLLPGLRLNARAGADVLNLREDEYRSPLIGGDYAESVNGISQSAFTFSTRYTAEGFATYSSTFGDAHDASVTGGASVELNDTEDNYLRAVNFANDYFKSVGDAAEVEDYSGGFSTHNLVSFFSRGSYIYDGRYILTANVRADGSSRFGRENRYGVFPAVALAWQAAEEPFLERYVGAGRVLSDLKLRVSYGLTGNQEIGNYTWRDAWTSTTYGSQPAIWPVQLENPGLTWETTRQWDVGVDLGLFGDRVTLTADYWDKHTSDLLYFRPVTYTTGFAGISSNIGAVDNRGFEFLLKTTNVRSSRPRGLRWETSLNLSHYTNNVAELYSDEFISTGWRSVNRAVEGYPLGAFFMLKFLGVDPATGNALYDNFDGGGVCLAAGTRTDDEAAVFCDGDDVQFVGSPHPDLTGGLTNTLAFGGFDLNVFALFSVGNEIFNATRAFADDGGASLDNKLAATMDRWQQPGDVTDVPRASRRGGSGAGAISSRFVEDGSFLRLKTVTLGYSVPEALAARVSARSLRIYASAQNVLTVTNYSGLDPESNMNGSGSNVALGTEFYTFPQPRTFTVGLTLGL